MKRGDLSLMVVSSTTPLLRHLSGVVRRFQAFSRNGYRASQSWQIGVEDLVFLDVSGVTDGSAAPTY